MLRNKVKYAFALTFLILLGFQSLYAFGWMGTETLNDYSSDMKRFDEDFFSFFEIDFSDDPNHDLNNMTSGLGKAWYTERATALTLNEQEKYAYVDVHQITKEVIDSDEVKIRVRLSGSLESVDSWTMYIWSNPGESNDEMLLMLTARNDVFTLRDLKNDESYDAEWSISRSEFYCTIDNETWNGNDVRFMSIETRGNDVIIDLYPNPIDELAVWITIIIVVLVIGVLALIYYYKKKAERV